MVTAIIGALLIGLTIGLLGSGGSILTVPILTYLLGHEAKVAIAESLAIVGSICLFGLIPFAWKRLIVWRSALFFGLPGMLGTYTGAWLSQFLPGELQLALFGGVLLLASTFMVRTTKFSPEESDRSAARWKIILQGLVVGMLTGLVGVGGGFLIVPALVLLGRLPIHNAVGTSLVIIAMQSFSGFSKYFYLLKSMDAHVDPLTILTFTLLGTLGSFTGTVLGAKLNQVLLRQLFAVFLVIMGIGVIVKEGLVLWRWSMG